MFTIKRIFLAMNLVFALTIFTGSDPTINLVGFAGASTPELAKPLISSSELLGQQVSTPTRSPFTSPQPVWKRLDYDILPPPRIGSSLIFNPVNKIALLFGGINSFIGELDDLWLTNGLAWVQFETPHSPGERSSASMAYDEARQVALLFGGEHNPNFFGDTWLFNGVDWIQQQPLASPSPRAGASMAYDADRNLTILFGGLADTGGKYWEALDEMWAWDGQNWQQLFPATLPLARWGANMVYDRAQKSILLFGGSVGGGIRDDTWLWDGISWIEQHPLHHPAGRANFGLAYDESRQQVILFGGQTEADVTETWAWDEQNWAKLPTRQAPPGELAYGAQLVYIPGLRTVLLYNALREKTVDPPYFNEHSEVWVLFYPRLNYLPIINR